jgi:hypothetical protein
MSRRLILALTLAATIVAVLAGPSGSQAAPGSLRVLVVANSLEPALPPAIAATPGIGTVDTFDSFSGTPSAATLATYDLVVGTGDSSYQDPVLWGDRLADFLDAGGAELQFAYDNWEDEGAHPTGRFESGGYPPFIPGNNDNDATTLGTILVPSSPLLTGVVSMNTTNNTTDAVAPGATLLAKWADDRNAIATKGQVVSVTAAPETGEFSPFSAAGQLAVNTGNVLGPRTLSVTKAGRGKGKVTSSPSRIDCGATCAANFGGGTTVTLKATPAKGKGKFSGWSGDCTGKSTCTVAMNSAARAVTATFSQKCKKKKKHKRSAESAKKKCKKKKR